MSMMHRLLHLTGTSGDRRDQSTQPARAGPELMANKPGQVWSWDIMSSTDLEGLEETRSVLSDPVALADIREADESYARGDMVRGADAVRGLRR